MNGLMARKAERTDADRLDWLTQLTVRAEFLELCGYMTVQGDVAVSITDDGPHYPDLRSAIDAAMDKEAAR